MPLVVTGFGPIDGPHRELARCVAELSAAIRARDGAEVRVYDALIDPDTGEEVAPAGQKITMRSLDFWRCENGLIRENWVLVDLLSVYQIGRAHV